MVKLSSHFLFCLTFVLISLISITNGTRPSVPTVIFVDSFTEYLSGHVKRYCDEHGIRIVECVSPYMQKVLSSQGYDIPDSLKSPNEGKEMDWAVSLNLFNEDDDDDDDHNGRSNHDQSTAVKSLKCPDIICLSESDAGVSTAERIQEELHLRGNGKSPHLRNKYLLNERASENGIKVVKQKLVQSLQDLESFLINSLHWKSVKKPTADDHVVDESIQHQHVACVLKPCIGVASEGVHKCHNFKEVKTAFQKLYLKPKYGGGLNEALVVQECLDGTEYAVDTVSRDGEIKVVALWKYKKYHLNKAPFVYQCSELVSARGVWEKQVCNYCVDVLTAAGVKWGPTHTEIMMTKQGPRLVEVNGRWHAQHFKPITDRCLGYDALTASIDAGFFPEKFDSLPSRPSRLQAEGVIIHLISVKQGNIMNINHIDIIKQLKSVVFIHMEYNIGDTLLKTVDIRTDCGYILLSHPDRRVMEEDYATIVKLQPTLFEVEEVTNDTNSKKSGKANKKSKTDVVNEEEGNNLNLDAFFEKVADDFVVSSTSPFDDDDEHEEQQHNNHQEQNGEEVETSQMNSRNKRSKSTTNKKSTKGNKKSTDPTKRRKRVTAVSAAEEALGFDSISGSNDNESNIIDNSSNSNINNIKESSSNYDDDNEEDEGPRVEPIEVDTEVAVLDIDVDTKIDDEEEEVVVEEVDEDEDEDFSQFSRGLQDELESSFAAESSSSISDSESNSDSIGADAVGTVLEEEEEVMFLASINRRTSDYVSIATEQTTTDIIRDEHVEKSTVVESPAVQTYTSSKTQIYQSLHQQPQQQEQPPEDFESTPSSSSSSSVRLAAAQMTKKYANRLKENSKGIRQKLRNRLVKVVGLLRKPRETLKSSSTATVENYQSTTQRTRQALTSIKNKSLQIIIAFRRRCYIAFQHKLSQPSFIQKIQNKVYDKFIKHYVLYKLGQISWKNSPGIKLVLGTFQLVVLSYILTFMSIVFIIPSLENYILQ